MMRRDHAFGRSHAKVAALALPLCAFLFFAPGVAVATTLPTTISSNTTLTEAGGPYTGTGVTVSSGVTLTVEPGTVVKITGLLKVNGTINVNGTAKAPVTFTSKKDDSFGGDTNGDGSATKPKAGDWSGIEFPASTEPPTASTFTHANFLYGGSGGLSSKATIEIKCPCSHSPEVSHAYVAHSPSHGIKINKGSPSITDSTIEDNAQTGIGVTSASPHIEGNTIADNKKGIDYTIGTGAHASVDINGNLIEDNESTGIEISAHGGSAHLDTASMGNNVLKGNGGKAIDFDAFPNSSESSEFVGNPVPPNITTNTLSGNAENGIWLSGRIAESTTWEDSGYALVVFEGGLNIGEGSTLTLEPGSVVKGEKRTIYVNGTLNPEGNAEEPVTFTSYRDDTVDGDTNGDGEATEPTLGDWVGIEYPSAKSALLEYLDLRYAEAAIGIGFLDSMEIAHSDFVYNEKAIDVTETAENSPELSALDCVPKYLSFVISSDNWYGKTGFPAPDIDISEVVGAVLPGEYAPLFNAASSLAELDYSLYGTDNTIPYDVYACPALGIPPTPFTPVIVLSTAAEPLFPDPEVE